MHLLRLRVTQKALRLPRFLFCSKVSRLQVFLYGLAKFCCACFMDCYPGRVWPVPKTFHCTYWKMFAQQTFSESQISWMRAWHAMCFRENNNGGSKRAHTVTDILRFRDPVFEIKLLYLQEHLYLYYNSVCGHQTWQDGGLPWEATNHKVTWTFDQKVLRDHVRN